MKGRSFTLAVFVFAAVFCTATLQGQTVQGVVTGTVVDSTGAVIPAADLTLTNDATNVSQEEKSGQDGSYRFPLVPPGTYTLTSKAGGFTTRQIKNIVVDASQTVPVAVTMSVGVSDIREGDSPDAVLARADAALYRAKDAGRNRVLAG